jgi:hypothetical protein
MPPDPVRAVDARAWLAKAAQDLRRVDLLLAADPPDPEGGLFHSQQAAEKALKGFLTWHDVPFRRVHELDESGTHEPGGRIDQVRLAFPVSGCSK